MLPGSALADVLATPGDDAAKIEALYLRTLVALARAGRGGALDRSSSPTRRAPCRRPAPPRADAQAGKKAAARSKQPDPLRRLEDRAAREKGTARVHAYEDVLWALLNSSEFVLNH